MLDTLTILLGGIAAGILITWLVLRERISSKGTSLERALSELGAKDNRISNLQEECSSLNAEVAANRVRLVEQQKAFEEKLAFKEVLGNEFKNLANQILDDKSRRFTEQNQLNLDALLKPLGKQISELSRELNKLMIRSLSNGCH